MSKPQQRRSTGLEVLNQQVDGGVADQVALIHVCSALWARTLVVSEVPPNARGAKEVSALLATQGGAAELSAHRAAQRLVNMLETRSVWSPLTGFVDFVIIVVRITSLA